MRWRLLLARGLAGALFASLTVGLLAGQAGTDAERAARLVESLGSKSYREREMASQELADMGWRARLALEEACKNPNDEVASRARQLLPGALKGDIRRLIDEFVADERGEKQTDLPGWQRFQSIAGKDVESRKLFTRIMQFHGELIVEAYRNPKSLDTLLPSAMESAYRRSIDGAKSGGERSIDPAEFCAFIFAVTMPRDGITTIADQTLYNLLYQRPTLTLFAEPKNTQARKLLLHWLTANSLSLDSHALTAIQNVRLKEALPEVARRLNVAKMAPLERVQLIVTVARLGGPEHVKDLDHARQVEGFITPTAQLRDIALAASLHLTDQKLADYGFIGSPTVFTPGALGFRNDTDRDAAHARFRDWLKTQKQVAAP